MCSAKGRPAPPLRFPAGLVTDCTANNNAGAILFPDNKTLLQTQPLYRPKAGGPLISWYHAGAPQDFPWEIDVTSGDTPVLQSGQRPPPLHPYPPRATHSTPPRSGCHIRSQLFAGSSLHVVCCTLCGHATHLPALGSHGGSGLSGMGGTIRLGELLNTTGPILHALKLEVWSGSVKSCTRATLHEWC